MPFRSQAQQRFAFGTKQPWAKRWANETDFSKLPKRVKRKALKAAPCMDCVLAGLKASAEGSPTGRTTAAPSAPKPAAGGRGEQIAPGITRIRGNLCNVHGRYGPCDAALSKKPKGGKGRKPRAAKPKAGAKPKQTPEQRAQARDAEHTANRAKVLKQLGLPEDAAGALDDLRAGKAVDDDGGLVKMGLAEQAADGSYRLTASGRALVNAANSGDPGRARDIMSAARDRKQARDTRQQASAQRHAAVEQRHADAEKKRAEREQERARRASEHKPGKKPKRTPIGRRGQTGSGTTGGAKPGSVGQSGGGGGGGSSGDDKEDIPRALRDAALALSEGRDADVASLVRNGLAKIDKFGNPVLTAAGLRAIRTKAFAVFKDSAGAYRWIARTTTAFEDRDEEIISTPALAESADSAGPRGPLRWWHMGRPDPLSVDRPWGPGVDLGWCDFAAISGRTLIESGTFKSEPIARAVAAHAQDLELSPGFFHAAGEPDASGVFAHIRIFERSLVPKWAGRASNPYTGLVVEKAMDQKKIQALKDLGASDAVITELLADVQQTEKAADTDGVRYKDASIRDLFGRLLRGEAITTKAEEPVEAAPVVEGGAPPADPIALLTAELKALREEVATLKAQPPTVVNNTLVEKAANPVADIAEEKQGGMGDMLPDDGAVEEEMAVEAAPVEEEAGGLTLSSDDLSAIGQVIAATLEPLIGALGITQKLDGHLSELKTMMSGYTKTKDDAQAALTARLDQTEAKVADLIGDAPRASGYRASQASDNALPALLAAVKDSPADAGPFADIVQQLFPNTANR
jgi:hypothetical protein